MTSLRTRVAAAALAGSTLFAGAAVPTALAQDDAPQERPSREDRLSRQQERLDAAVESGRISPERAAEIRARLEERVAAMEARRAEKQAAAAELAAAVGVTVDELKEARRAGQSLADVAIANGGDVDAAVDLLVSRSLEKLAQAVDSGRIDADRAAEIEAGLVDRIAARVNGEKPERGERPARPDRERPGRGD